MLLGGMKKGNENEVYMINQNRTGEGDAVSLVARWKSSAKHMHRSLFVFGSLDCAKSIRELMYFRSSMIQESVDYCCHFIGVYHIFVGLDVIYFTIHD